MGSDENEEQRLRTAALKNAESIRIVRQRAERELLAAKKALERKTEELQQQREWFEVTLASIGDAVITTDVQSRVTYLNPIAEAMTGRSLAQVKGEPLERVFRIVNEHTRQTVENPISKVLQTGKIVGLANHSMFSQVASSRDRSEGGLGIGLALAKGLIELHGGRIEARSAGIGQGSEFIVRLPLRRTSVPREKQAIRSTSEQTVSRRVLIADDNRDAAESLAMLLRMDGHDVTVVHDGKEALAAFSAVRPEVALLDIGMPKLNGYQLARRVRQGSLGRAVTLIAVTGWGQDKDKAQALAAGFNHHFMKPVDADRLCELLRSEGLRN